MIYTMKYPNGSMKIDTDRIAKKFAGGGQLFVRTFSPQDRAVLTDYLDAEGFRFITSKRTIRESSLPLLIELPRNSVSVMGNITCAAAAAGSAVVMSDRDFYLLHSIWKLRHEK